MKTTKNYLSRVCGLVFLSVILMVINSCKEPDLIGLNVQPDSDLFNTAFTDSTSIIAFSEKTNRINTDELINNLLGSCNDPVFGLTTAGFYTQLRLSGNNVDFGSNPKTDSLVLRLFIRDVYGDSNALHTLRVYEVSQDFYRDSVYYSNSRLSVYGTPLASHQAVFRKKDSVMVGGEMLAPHVAIRLKPEILGNKLTNASGSYHLVNNDNFVKFIKGLYVSAEPAQNAGSIAYLDLVNSLSKLTLYYSNDSTSGLKYDFPINENCARFTSFQHYRYESATPLLRTQIIDKDTLAGDSMLFLQAMAGVRVKIYFPHLKNFASDKSIVIHKAELILKVEDHTTSPHSPPLRLALARINELGNNEFLPDDPFPHGGPYFGGHYDASRLEYRFRINQHINNLINSRYEDYGLSLMVSGASTSAARTIIHGSSRNKNPLRLRITYTKLD